MKNKKFELEFQEKLKEQLRKHREKHNFSQLGVANAVEKSLDAYQRWESSGKCLTNIFTLLSVFKELKFSTAEIIDVLSLPPLTLSEIKAIYQDEDTLENIKENGIYLAMRKKCPDMDDFTLEKLLALFLNEHLKRLESRHEKL